SLPGGETRASIAASGGVLPASGLLAASGFPAVSGRIWMPLSAAPLAASALGTMPECDPRKPLESIMRTQRAYVTPATCVPVQAPPTSMVIVDRSWRARDLTVDALGIHA